jgi:hypothetical protein
MGSIVGTFIKCRHHHLHKIEDGSLFQLGSHVSLRCRIKDDHIELDDGPSSQDLSLPPNQGLSKLRSTLKIDLLKPGKPIEHFSFVCESKIGETTAPNQVFPLARERSHILDGSLQIVRNHVGNQWNLQIVDYRSEDDSLWMSTSLYFEGQERFQPREILLKDQDEFRVSETVFKVWFKC